MTFKEEHAIKTDLKKLLGTINPEYVSIYKLDEINEDSIDSYKVKLKNIITYVDTPEGGPFKSDHIEFFVDILPDYPKTKPRVYFGDERWLHYINRFKSIGHPMCTGEYDGNNDSLVKVITQTIRAAVFDPEVSNYKSMADSSVEAWQKQMEAAKKLPTMKPSLLFAGGTKRVPYAV